MHSFLFAFTFRNAAALPHRYFAVLRFTRLKTDWTVGTPEFFWHMPVPAGCLPN